MSSEPLFAMREVVVRTGDAVALDGVTVDIPDGGAITALQGPSGAGKSTLLRLCNRLEVPTSGTVSFRGTDLSELDPLVLRRRVGMVFQRPTLFPGTVRDNLLVADPELDDEGLDELLERAHVPDVLIDRDTDVVSGGEAQRICLARTLATRPEVLLMDEPTSALDPSATRALEQLGRSLADAGTPVLWVTHDLAQSERVADRRVVLVRGRVATDDELAHYLASESADHDHPADDHHHHDGGEIHREDEHGQR